MTYDRSQLVMHPKPPDFSPVPTFPEGHRFAGSARCTAWSTRNGRQCLGMPVKGKDKCYQHGGATPGGIASANWKHGRTSKYLPARMQDTYNASMHDKELLSLRNEISILDGRIIDLIQRVDLGESGHLWLKSKDVLVQLRKALVTQDTKKVSETIIELDELIRRGYSDYGAWEEVLSAMELRRRLVETERRRLVEMQQMITAEQAQAYLRALTLAVRENVSDANVLNRIQTAFIRISNKPSD